MTARAVRVLHVLGSLDRGGAETWVVQLLDLLDRSRVDVDLLVHRAGGPYEADVRRTGARVFCIDSARNPLRYSRELVRLLRESGPYDVVHSHLQLFSAIVLRAAASVGVPCRIAHARNSLDGQRWTPARAAYRALMRWWIARYSTRLFAVSLVAAEGCFGAELLRRRRCDVLTGIDFSPLRLPIDRATVRAELGIDSGAKAVGHVGSFRTQKNHPLLVRIAKEACARDPAVRFVLVGEGRLRRETEAAVRSAGLEHRVLFLGERSDATRVLQAMDAFVFPSLYEGLPRALLEAQAAGLPCVASDAISAEATAGAGHVQFLPLDASPAAWCDALGAALTRGASSELGRNAIRLFEERGLTMEANARLLTELYETLAPS